MERLELNLTNGKKFYSALSRFCEKNSCKCNLVVKKSYGIKIDIGASIEK
jgi:hypothetical protein